MIALLMFFVHLFKNADWFPFNPVLTAKYTLSKIDMFFNLDRTVEYTSFKGGKVLKGNEDYILWYENIIYPAIVRFSKEAIIYSLRWFVTIFVGSLFFFIGKGISLSRKKHLRGMSIVSDKELKKQIFWHNWKKLYFAGYKIGGFNYPKDTEHQHTLITGGPGTGKTQTILDLMEQIRKKNGKAVIYDKMGTFVRKLYDPKRDMILNPFDARSANWSIFSEAKESYEFDAIAASLTHKFHSL